MGAVTKFNWRKLVGPLWITDSFSLCSTVELKRFFHLFPYKLMGPIHGMSLFSDPIKVFSLLIVQYGVHQGKLSSECWSTAWFPLFMLSCSSSTRTAWANNHREIPHSSWGCLAESGKSIIIRTGKGQWSPQWGRGMETDIITALPKYPQAYSFNLWTLMSVLWWWK